MVGVSPHALGHVEPSGQNPPGYRLSYLQPGQGRAGGEGAALVLRDVGPSPGTCGAKSLTHGGQALRGPEQPVRGSAAVTALCCCCSGICVPKTELFLLCSYIRG